MADRPQPADPAAFTPDSLSAAVGGRVLLAGDLTIRGGAADSRRVKPGNIFFALAGERTDGHKFVLDAVRGGAAAVVVSEAPAAGTLDELAAPGGPTVVIVDDTLDALRRAATEWRNRFSPLVVGVTGSLAKTSTKEQVAEVLSGRWRVLRNMANENNEIGLPLTVLRMDAQDEVAVLEMGMYVSGDISVLAGIAQPHIGVVTAVRGTHLERAGSLDAIEAGKRELVEALPAGGSAVLNMDDQRVARMTEHAPAGVRVIGYGFGPTADVRAEDVESRAAAGMAFTLVTDAAHMRVRIPAMGRHSVHNALAAGAVGLAAGLSMDEIGSGLARPLHMPHRTTLISAGAWHILDDSYNAAPDSMIAALDLLSTMPGRRMAVLGEMLELGAESEPAHRLVGRHAAHSADVLVAVGAPAQHYAAAALEAGMVEGSVVTVADRAAALAELADLLRPGDVILVKASNGMRFFDLVDDLVALANRESRA